MLAFAGSGWPTPARFDAEDSGQGIEATFLRVYRTVGCLPPIAMEKTRHHPIAIAAMPNEYATRPEHAAELADDATIVCWIGEESKRSEEVQHRVKPFGPFDWQPTHVATMIPQPWTGPPRAGSLQERAR